MAETKWDAIIVGGGPGGLATGALLAKAGKKVLVLEKDPLIAGRARAGIYEGHILDNGGHGPMGIGYMEEVFSRIGKPYPSFNPPMTKTEMYKDGKWHDLMAIAQPRADMRRIISDIVAKSPDEIENFNDVSLEQWINSQTNSEGLRTFFYYMGAVVCVGNRFGPISAGSFMSFIKTAVEKTGGFGKFGGQLAGGMSTLYGPLADALRERGGELRTGARVTNIVIKGGIVRGVEVEVGEKVIPSQILDTQYIEAPIVVSTLPLWDMFAVVSEDVFPNWYVDWVKSISSRVSYVYGILYGTDKLLFEESTSRWIPTPPRTKTLMLALWQQSYGAARGQHQLMFAVQGLWGELPNPFSSDGRTKRQVRDFLDLLEKDIADLFPDLRQHTLWRVRQASIYSLAETPGTIGSHRPGVQPPGVANLYFVGDTLKESKLTGTQAAAATALKCADLILRKKE